MADFRIQGIFFLVLSLFLLLGCASLPSEGLPDEEGKTSPPVQSGGIGAAQTPESQSLSELMQKNTPLECEIELEYGGQEITSKIYIKGQSYRYLVNLPSFGGPGEIEMVLKNDSLYTRLSGSPLLPGCSWIKSDILNSDSQAYAPASIPGARFSCKPGSFGEEIFETAGKTCSESDLPAFQQP